VNADKEHLWFHKLTFENSVPNLPRNVTGDLSPKRYSQQLPGSGAALHVTGKKRARFGFPKRAARQPGKYYSPGK
jgi:hypothetical protein